MIQTEITPNPDSLKFLSEKTLSTIGTEEFKKENKNKIKVPFIREKAPKSVKFAFGTNISSAYSPFVLLCIIL